MGLIRKGANQAADVQIAPATIRLEGVSQLKGDKGDKGDPGRDLTTLDSDPYVYYSDHGSIVRTGITTSTAVPNPGELAYELVEEFDAPGGILPNRDFRVEWEGFAIWEFDQNCNVEVILRTTHRFGTGFTKIIIQDRSHFEDAESGTRHTIPLNEFNSTSRVTLGAYPRGGTNRNTPIQITQADVDGVSKIKYELVFKLFNRKSETNRRDGNLTYLQISPNAEVVSYQLGGARGAQGPRGPAGPAGSAGADSSTGAQEQFNEINRLLDEITEHTEGTSWADLDHDTGDHFQLGYDDIQSNGTDGTSTENHHTVFNDFSFNNVGAGSRVVVIWVPTGQAVDNYRVQHKRGGSVRATYPASGQYWREYDINDDNTSGQLSKILGHFDSYFLASESSDSPISNTFAVGDVITIQKSDSLEIIDIPESALSDDVQNKLNSAHGPDALSQQNKDRLDSLALEDNVATTYRNPVLHDGTIGYAFSLEATPNTGVAWVRAGAVESVSTANNQLLLRVPGGTDPNYVSIRYNVTNNLPGTGQQWTPITVNINNPSETFSNMDTYVLTDLASDPKPILYSSGGFSLRFRNTLDHTYLVHPSRVAPAGATAGQALLYNATNKEWEPGNVSGGSSGGSGIIPSGDKLPSNPVKGQQFLKNGTSTALPANMWRRFDIPITLSNVWRKDIAANDDFVVMSQTGSTFTVYNRATGETFLSDGGSSADGGMTFHPNGTLIQVSTSRSVTAWDISNITTGRITATNVTSTYSIPSSAGSIYGIEILGDATTFTVYVLGRSGSNNLIYKRSSNGSWTTKTLPTINRALGLHQDRIQSLCWAGTAEEFYLPTAGANSVGQSRLIKYNYANNSAFSASSDILIPDAGDNKLSQPGSSYQTGLDYHDGVIYFTNDLNSPSRWGVYPTAANKFTVISEEELFVYINKAWHRYDLTLPV